MAHFVTDDDLDWDDWMSLSDEQQKAIVDQEMAEYGRRYDALPLAQKIKHRRKSSLDNCRSSRRVMRTPNCPEIIRENMRKRLKSAQICLLKVRTWRISGIYPGVA